jgi:hypothetical protein
MTSFQKNVRLQDWVAETPESVNARLEGAKAIQAQTQFTLGTMTVVAMMMLIVSYNAYLSFDSGWALAEAARKSVEAKSADAKSTQAKAAEDKPAAATTVADVLSNEALKSWVSSQSVTIALLGIRVSVDDAPVLGSAALFVLSLWLLLLTRRENHTIGYLLRDTDTPNQGNLSNGQRWLIFHTIISNNLFVTFDRSLSRIQSLDGPSPLAAGANGRLKSRLSRAAFGFVRTFFFLFPVFACAVVFGLDRWSYFRPDPFAPNAEITGTGHFFWQSMLVFFACWIPLTVCCGRSSQYSKATETVLREYGRKLRAHLVRQQQHAPI